jgi:hypothetical protein
MLDFAFYCLGDALFAAVIFFPLTCLAMKSQFTLRGSLGKAWRPFGYSVVLLTVAQFIEIGTRVSQDVQTAAGLVCFLLVPIMICAAVIYLTYRYKTAATPPPAS